MQRFTFYPHIQPLQKWFCSCNEGKLTNYRPLPTRKQTQDPSLQDTFCSNPFQQMRQVHEKQELADILVHNHTLGLLDLDTSSLPLKEPSSEKYFPPPHQNSLKSLHHQKTEQEEVSEQVTSLGSYTLSVEQQKVLAPQGGAFLLCCLQVHCTLSFPRWYTRQPPFRVLLLVLLFQN